MVVYFDAFPMYLDVFMVHFNVFEYIHSLFEYIYGVFIVHFNVFINIVIGISPSHSHYNVFTMRIHQHIFFLLSTMTPFPTYSTITLFSLIPIDLF
jgi:hypothetical protein